MVNFCLSSGLSVLTVFISLLCAILASAFYKYTTSREQMSTDDSTYTLVNQENNNLDKPITLTSITEPSIAPTNESNHIETIESISEIEITFEENTHENGIEHEENIVENEENHEETTNDILIDTVEGTEEEIQKWFRKLNQL